MIVLTKVPSRIGVLALGMILVLSAIPPALAPRVPGEVRVIIGFNGMIDTSMITGQGGKVLRQLPAIRAIAASLPESKIDNIRGRAGIAYIELDSYVYALPEVLPWGVDRIDADDVHQYNKGTGISVAIIDTGIDYNHPDLDANYMGGVDYVEDDGDPMDDNGHGTHCAGIVAAEDNDFGVIGVAPEAWLYAVKVLDSTGSGYVSDVVAGIQWAIDNGMQVISMSLGSDSDSQTLHAACDAAYDAGIVIVAAAGNDYRRRGRVEFDTVDYPARYSSVIAVGATDSNDEKASFSSTGPDLELAAPGVHVLSTYRGDYAYGDGTSMACPHVAGTAALVLAGEPHLTNAEVRTRLEVTADDLGTSGWDSWYGYGLVDADEAAPQQPGEPNTAPIADADGPYTGIEDIPITFDGTRSSDPDEDPLTYSWDFGDGNKGTGVLPSHTYLAGGTYAVILIVNDGKIDSEPSTTSATIAEVNDPPIADAGPDQTVLVGEAVTFDGSGSYDIDGTINTYDWDFGDGTTGTGATTIHTYVTAGTYTLGLTVTDNGVLTDTDEAIVTVTEAPAYPIMHVASIDMDTDSKIAGRNTFVWAIATMTVLDAYDAPIQGATVYGHWAEATTDIDSGTTDADGLVSLESDSVKNPSGTTTFWFVVDDVVLSGWTYDPSGKTSDYITV